MPEEPRVESRTESSASEARSPWSPPTFEVIPLDCEITAYAPDGGDPLF